MTKDRRRIFKLLRLSVDLTLVVLIYVLIRGGVEAGYNPFRLDITWHPDYLFKLPFMLTLSWGFAFLVSGAYESDTRRVGLRQALWVVAKVMFLMLAVFGIALFVLKVQHLSRKAMGAYMVLCWFFLSLSKWTELRLLKSIRGLGVNTMSVLLVGEGAELRRASQVYEENQDWGYRVVGAVTLGPAHAIAGLRVLGRLSALQEVLRTRIVDELVFAAPPTRVSQLSETLERAAQAGVTVRVLLGSAYGSASTLEPFGQAMSLVARLDRRNPYALMVKELADRGLALLALIMLAPLLALIALAVALRMGWPVFFSQKRAGQNGRAFFLYKFRTMVLDARARQVELGEANEMDGPVFKVKNDPRVTPLGRFLRRTTLDELPQFLNVLKGEMSLVGPRPLANYEARKVPAWARRRYSVKPGLTCYWQVMGRNKLSFEQWMKLDLRYIDEWSLGLDLKLLIKTLPALLFTRGAY